MKTPNSMSSEPGAGQLACRGKDHHRNLAAALQCGGSTFEPRLPYAKRVRGSPSKRSVSHGNGPGRCGIGAFAPRPVAPTAPRGANAAIKGGRLKLTVVRKNWAGHLVGRNRKTEMGRRPWHRSTITSKTLPVSH